MKKTNKAFTIDDFIIFLKAKIVIILVFTLLLSSISIYFQVDFEDYWEVKISRTIDRDALIETLEKVNEIERLESKEYDARPSRVELLRFIKQTNELIESAMITSIERDDYTYSDVSKSSNENLFKKQIVNLKVENLSNESTDIIENKMISLINDIRILTKRIIALQFNLNQSQVSNIYDFEILNINQEPGYEIKKSLKIILISFIATIFFIFIYNIRKSINLF